MDSVYITATDKKSVIIMDKPRLVLKIWPTGVVNLFIFKGITASLVDNDYQLKRN